MNASNKCIDWRQMPFLGLGRHSSSDPATMSPRYTLPMLNASRSFGYDLFISYHRPEASAFADALTRDLKGRQFSCYIDRTETLPGEELLPHIRRALRRSRMLVVIVTPGAIMSPWVTRELEEFLRQPTKRIIPIDTGVLGQPIASSYEPWRQLQGRDWLSCSQHELASGQPAPAIGEGIDRAFKGTRSKTKFRRLVLLVCALLFGIAAVAVWQSVAARKAAQDANAQRMRAIRQTDEALRQRTLAKTATLSAERHATFAVASQLAAESDLLRISLDDWTVPALLALESMSRLHLLANDMAVRDFTPIKRPTADLRGHGRLNWSLKYSPDGRYLAAGTSTVSVFDVARRKEIARIPCGFIFSLAFSSDGHLLHIASRNGALITVQTSTGREPRRIESVPVMKSAVFSSDGRFEAVQFQDDDRGMVIFDTASQNHPVRLTRPTGQGLEAPVQGDVAAFDAKNENIAVCDPTFLRVFDVTTGKEVVEYLPSAFLRISGYRIAFTKDGTSIVTDGYDGVRVLRFLKNPGDSRLPRTVDAGAALLASLPETRGVASSLTLSPDEQIIARPNSDGSVRLVELTSDIEVARLSDAGFPVAFSSDGRFLATHSYSKNAITVFRLDQGVVVARFQGQDAQFNPDGTQIAAIDGDTVHIYEHFRPTSVLLSTRPDTHAIAVALGAEDRIAAISGISGSTQVLSLETGRTIATFPAEVRPHGSQLGGRFLGVPLGTELANLTFYEGPHTHIEWSGEPRAFSLALDPTNTFLAVGSDDGATRVFDIAGKRQIVRLSCTKPVWGLAFSRDGHRLAVCSLDGTLKVYDTARWSKVSQFTPEDPAAALCIAFDSHGRNAIVGYWNNTARIVEVSSGKEIALIGRYRRPVGFESGVVAVAFSPDGRLVAMGSRDSRLRICDVSFPDACSEFINADAVGALAFSLDGRYLASGSFDGTARVFDVGAGQEISRLTFFRPVRDVAFSLDGKNLRVVTLGDPSGYSVTWNFLHPQDLIADLCARLARNLTNQEWRQYLGDESYRKTCPGLP